MHIALYSDFIGTQSAALLLASTKSTPVPIAGTAQKYLFLSHAFKVFMDGPVPKCEVFVFGCCCFFVFCFFGGGDGGDEQE